MRARAAARPVDETLHLIVRCHEHVMAIETAHIERMLLASEEVVRRGAHGPTLTVGGRDWAVWDLGSLFSKGPQAHAWVLLNVPDASGEVPIALATGACLVVRALTRPTPLPAAIFAGRPGAIAGAFDARNLERAPDALVGFVLDVGQLLSPEELLASRVRTAPGEELN